ncbi:bifunctional 2-polyprenyl-6-hydroxyphenol methylase/3-demethylubiquinol 3-O-methyltransferase UbiG [Rugamonas sp.]|uniref:class I SAM-dependent methyltransferase n=1 Tax=Rugamonas sp. TaxID=1926287 RepID=UPI0025DB4FA8|nr:class I SAM-dependent methyltransferase [Rugamonas sp.]
MGLPTDNFYNRYVHDGAIKDESPQSAISRYFKLAFRIGDKILDIGSGSGRDLTILLENGFDAYGVEPNDSIRKFSLTNHPGLADRLHGGSLPIIDVPFVEKFDGLVCSAVLMHIYQDEFLAACMSMRRILKPNGRILLSVPLMRPELLKGVRDKDGRFFKNHSTTYISAILASLGFFKIELSNTSIMEFPDVTWTILLFELSSE